MNVFLKFKLLNVSNKMERRQCQSCIVTASILSAKQNIFIPQTWDQHVPKLSEETERCPNWVKNEWHSETQIPACFMKNENETMSKFHCQNINFDCERKHFNLSGMDQKEQKASEKQ